jgi:hypothetical protein
MTQVSTIVHLSRVLPGGHAGVRRFARVSGLSDTAAAWLYAPRAPAYAEAMHAALRPGLGALAHAPRAPARRAPLARLRRGLPALAVALCAALCTLPARAAGDYDAALREGVAARDRARASQFVGDWQSALEFFQRAVALDDTAAARFELAEAAAALDRVELAYESYELALAGGLPARAEAIAHGYLDTHAADVAHLEVAAPEGTTISVDGRERGRTPLRRPLVVGVGRVTIRLTAADGLRSEQTLELEPGVLRRIAWSRSLRKSSSARATRADVSQAPRPLPSERPAPPAEQPDEPSWLGSRPAAIVLLSVAGASMVAGGWLALEAHGSNEDADDTRDQILAAYASHLEQNVITAGTVPCGNVGIASGVAGFQPSVPIAAQETIVQQYANACDQLAQREARTDRLTTASMIGLGVGAAASAALLTWYIASPREHAPGDEPRRPLVAPIVSKDTQGVYFALTF